MAQRESWFSTPTHDALRSVEVARVIVALVLLTHPLHALLHPADALELALKLGEHGVPWGNVVAWSGLALQLVAGAGLLVRRFATPAALASMLVVGVGAAVLYAPRWFVLGGDAEDCHPGVELSVVLLVVLAALAWTFRSRDKATRSQSAELGLQIIAIGTALAMLPHGYGPFVKLDFEGMRQWGEAMARAGWPCGVALVWGVKVLELCGVIARVSRRLVVPACLGHLLILVPGMVISQKMDWFNVGPGEGGIEYPVLLSAGAVASILAYWPRKK